MNINRVAGLASLFNAVLGAAMLLVAFGLIGIEAFADREKLVQLAKSRPGVLILQDVLKLISACVTVVLVGAIYRILKPASPKAQKMAGIFGLFGVLALLANASLSFYAISQTSNTTINKNEVHELSSSIGMLAVAVLLMTGIWYLLINWSARRSNYFPKWISTLGIVTGILFLIPPLGILAGLASIVWSLALANRLLKK
jgi:hypothetical protein